jgi:trehalose/maltose hydrolase-like predicted phosphorylase
MAQVAKTPRTKQGRPSAEKAPVALRPELDRRFEAVVFDWDGTAVPDRAADASAVRRLLEDLCEFGMELFVVTGTHVGNVDGQLQARPKGLGRLHLCLNRGSEVFRVDETGVRLLTRREATPEEDAALTAAAEATVAKLAERGLQAEIVSRRLNRRKIDLIPVPAWADPPKARIDELLAAVEERLHRADLAGLGEAVELAEVAAREAGLEAPRVTSDAKHVEIGLTDKADSASWVFHELRHRGIAPGLVLAAGDEFGPLGGLPGSDSLLLVPQGAGATAISVGREPTGVPDGVISLGGGPARFLDLLEDQLERRRRGDVPEIDSDPAWTITVGGLDPELERVHEAILSFGDGLIGTSGSPVGSHPAARPRVLAAGLYDGDGPETDLFPCPIWTRLDGELPREPSLVRRLDLRSGLLHQEMHGDNDGLSALLFASLARPGTAALRAQGEQELLRSDTPLVPPESVDARSGSDAGRFWLLQAASEGGVAAAAKDTLRGGRLERLAAYRVDPERTPEASEALRRLDEAEQAGFERLLTEHRRSWAQRWEEADIVIEGDAELQRAVRFALFQTMGSVADFGEAAVGARGLTGPAYRGHVFWDADVYVLPLLAATHPQAARAMLEYRIRRLPDARAFARESGRRGARFAWESARDGVDVTPLEAHDQTGRVMHIHTGELEEHITADVAWAAACYIDWTGDTTFAEGPGRVLFVETARYWASRIGLDEDGRGHIDHIIGPDEYHEPVDDNAFTNVMAAWNLRRATAAVEGTDAVPSEERRAWVELADSLVDNYDPETGIYEQFPGFFELEPIVVADIAPHRPIAADLLVGKERVMASQVIKQADVLMLHHMVPDAVAPGSLGPNLDFYEPRTSHGSSLSPAIHASVLARAGRLDDALETLRLASRIDFDDLTGTTAGGLHLATMGGLWQALAFGFAGLRPEGDALGIDPRLPGSWDALEVRVSFRGKPVRVRIEPDVVTVEADPVVQINVTTTEGRRFERR